MFELLGTTSYHDARARQFLRDKKELLRTTPEKKNYLITPLVDKAENKLIVKRGIVKGF